MAEFSQEELEAANAGPEDVVEDPTPPAEQQPAPARDEQGRFAPSPKEEGAEDAQVPYRALKSERNEHRETKAQLQAAQERLRQIDEWRSKAAQAQPQVQQQPAEEDPTGIEYLRRRVEELEGNNFQRTQRETESVAENERIGVLTSTLAQSEQAFKQATPDYDQAVEHMLRGRAQQLQLMGVNNPVQLQQILRAEAADLAQTAIELQRDPAEFVYEYSRIFGYQPQAAPQQQAANPMFDAIAKGQQRKSLSGARGVGVKDHNADAVASMSEDEFFAAMRDPEFARMMERMG
jgi:hypothetical protein